MITLLFCLFGVPALSLFIKKTYEPGMIFRRIYLFFIYHWIKNWRKCKRYKRFFIKPFICVYCFNVWITIFYYLIFIKFNLLLLPLFIGFTYLILEIYLKIVK